MASKSKGKSVKSSATKSKAKSESKIEKKEVAVVNSCVIVEQAKNEYMELHKSLLEEANKERENARSGMPSPKKSVTVAPAQSKINSQNQKSPKSLTAIITATGGEEQISNENVVMKEPVITADSNKDNQSA